MPATAQNVRTSWSRRICFSYGVAGAIALIIFVSDFFIKSYLKDNFAYQSIPVIKSIFHITIVFNKGAAFGLLKGYSNILIYIGIIFIIVLFAVIKKDAKNSMLSMAALGLILGGALSNMFDRVAYGFVVDYIDFRVWPVFNLSDMCISIGVGIFMLQSFFSNGKKHISG